MSVTGYIEMPIEQAREQAEDEARDRTARHGKDQRIECDRPRKRDGTLTTEQEHGATG